MASGRPVRKRRQVENIKTVRPQASGVTNRSYFEYSDTDTKTYQPGPRNERLGGESGS